MRCAGTPQKAPSGATASLRCEPHPDRAQGASGPAGFARVRYSRCSEGVAVDREARGGEGGADAADRLVDDVRTHRGVAL
jgi:hypothetical protein